MECIISFNNNPIIAFIISILSMSGVIISIATLIVVANYRKKLIRHKERSNFSNGKQLFLSVLIGAIDNLENDDIYAEKFLNEIRVAIINFNNTYTFISRTLKRQIKNIYKFIKNKCCISGEINNSYKQELIEKLNHLKILTEKEDELI